MTAKRCKRGGFAWLELLLVLALLALVFQVFPSLWHVMWAALDVRNWSRTTWFVLNIVVVITLFGVRFGPEIAASFQERRRKPRRRVQSDAGTASQQVDADYEARRQREWVERAKKRMPWHP